MVENDMFEISWTCDEGEKMWEMWHLQDILKTRGTEEKQQKCSCVKGWKNREEDFAKSNKGPEDVGDLIPQVL